MKRLISLTGTLARSAFRHPAYTRALVRRKIRLALRHRWIRRHPEHDGRVPPPLVYKLVLTYRCNLRCKGCFQWGETGWCRSAAPEGEPDVGTGELDWDLVEALLSRVGPSRPDFILTGGEPLVYSRFEELAARLAHHRCSTTVCTNGTLLDRLSPATEANRYLAFLVSLDGPAEVNDAIRGHGGFARVVESIRRIKRARRPGWVGIQCTIRPENVDRLHAFCEEMIGLGVDWILLNPFWFITEAEARAYERFLEERYQVKPACHLGFQTPLEIDPGVFAEQFERIQAASWPVQVSSYFRGGDEFRAYLEEPAELIQSRGCAKQWIRADITPEGYVAPCIQFPDLEAGHLREASVLDIWNGPICESLRRTLRRETLPVCARCNNLYLYDARRRYL